METTKQTTAHDSTVKETTSSENQAMKFMIFKDRFESQNHDTSNLLDSHIQKEDKLTFNEGKEKMQNLEAGDWKSKAEEFYENLLAKSATYFQEANDSFKDMNAEDIKQKIETAYEMLKKQISKLLSQGIKESLKDQEYKDRGELVFERTRLKLEALFAQGKQQLSSFNTEDLNLKGQEVFESTKDRANKIFQSAKDSINATASNVSKKTNELIKGAEIQTEEIYKQGKEMVQNINTDGVQEKVEEIVKEAKEKAHELHDHGEEMIPSFSFQGLKKRASEIYEVVKEKIHELHEHGKEMVPDNKIAQMKGKAGETFDNAKNKASELYNEGREFIQGGSTRETSHNIIDKGLEEEEEKHYFDDTSVESKTGIINTAKNMAYKVKESVADAAHYMKESAVAGRDPEGNEIELIGL